MTRLQDGEDHHRQLKNLDPVHRALYLTVMSLESKSIMEYGCGGGDHLYNLKKLTKDVRLAGVDRSFDQIKLAFDRNKLSDVWFYVISDKDCAIDQLSKFDISYTQAVLMHIQTDASYMRAVRFMLASTSRYIVLRENFARHNFIQDFKKMSAQMDLGWKKIYFYTLTKKRMHNLYAQSGYLLTNSFIIISKEKLNGDEYVEVNDLTFLSENLDPQTARTSVY